MKKRCRLYVALAAALTGIAVLTATSFAVFTDAKTDDTTITAGEVSISAEPVSKVSTDGYLITSSADNIRVSDTENVKAVKYNITNDGTKKVYVRAQVVPVIQTKQGDKWVTDTSLSLEDVELYVTTGNDASVDSWIYSDGYFYFPNIVNAGDSFSAYIGCNVPEAQGRRVIFDVDIQASQATHNAYAKNWDIQGLPAGVEVLKSFY